MADSLTLISGSQGTHYLYIGMDTSSSSSFSIQMFVEKSGPRAVEWFSELSLGFVSFLGADVWVHNSDDVPRNNFYGEQKDGSIVGIVANEQPQLVKTFDSIEINSSGNATIGDWEVTSITVPESINHPNGMYSKIPEGKFKKREGVLYAEFLRNMKTSSSVVSVVDALSGETLRGNVAYLLLTNRDTEQVKLFRVSINSTISTV